MERHVRYGKRDAYKALVRMSEGKGSFEDLSIYGRMVLICPLKK
jgi:hypothetical protein